MKRSFQNRSIAILEDKRMMAANLIGSGMAAMHGAASAVQASGSTAVSTGVGAGTAGAAQNVSGATHLSGLLSGTGQGIVSLVSRTVNGVTSANGGQHVGKRRNLEAQLDHQQLGQQCRERWRCFGRSNQSHQPHC